MGPDPEARARISGKVEFLEISEILQFGVDIAEPIFRNSMIFVKHMGRYGYGGPPGPWTRSGPDLDQIWTSFGPDLDQFGTRSGPDLVPFWVHFWSPFGSLLSPVLDPPGSTGIVGWLKTQ